MGVTATVPLLPGAVVNAGVIPWRRKSGSTPQRFVREPLRGTNCQAVRRRSTTLREGTISEIRSHDPPCRALGRSWRPLDTPPRSHVRGPDLEAHSRRLHALPEERPSRENPNPRGPHPRWRRTPWRGCVPEVVPAERAATTANTPERTAHRRAPIRSPWARYRERQVGRYAPD